jgi:hypothetical protein
VLKQKFIEAIQRQQMAQRIKEAEMQHGAQIRGQNVSMRGQDITARGQDQMQGRFDTSRSDDLAAAKAAAEKQAADEAAFEQFAGQLPAHLKPVAIAKKKFGVTMAPDDLVNAPQTREEAAAAKLKGLEQETETRERIQAKYRPAPAPRDERLVQVEGPNGVATWVRESEAVGKPAAQAARAVTGSERQTLAYFNRAKDADSTAVQFEEKVAGAGLGSQLRQQYAPNMLQNPEQQAYRQAQRAFTEARLRKESGAAIPQGEYENDARTYFAQPGDSPQVREQKRKARQVVLEGLKYSSGKAYNEFYGDEPKGKAAPAQGGNKVSITSITEIK